VETSTFGSEFVSMRIGTELIEALCYKLRMFGVPIDGPASVFGDNGAVVKNTTLLLSKKHIAICDHRVREAVAAGTIQVAKEGNKTNLADLFTKILATSGNEEIFITADHVLRSDVWAGFCWLSCQWSLTDLCRLQR